MKYAATDPRTFENLRANDPRNRRIWAEFLFSERGKKPQKMLEGLHRRILFELLSKETKLIEFVADVIQDDTGIQELWSLISLEAALWSITEQKKTAVNICLFIDALNEHSGDCHRTHWRLLETQQNLRAVRMGLSSRSWSVSRIGLRISSWTTFNTVRDLTHMDSPKMTCRYMYTAGSICIWPLGRTFYLTMTL